MKSPVFILILLLFITACSTSVEQTCQPMTCQEYEELYGKVDYSKSQYQIYTIFIIDSSKSMEGEYIDETKSATQKLIQGKRDHEYIAIIEFNEDAQIISSFTNDKEDLISRINLINTRGRTRFAEAFTLAKNLLEEAPTSAQKNIIILSDGSPEDQPEELEDIISELKATQTPIYTIAFGEDSNKQILEEIATRQNLIYTVDTLDELENTFGKIYSNIQEAPAFKFTFQNLLEEYTVGQDIELIMNTLSSFNGEEINQHCNAPFSTTLEISSGTFQDIIQSDSTGKKFSLSNLQPNTYELHVNANYELDSCSFSTEEIIGSIEIVEEKNICSFDCDFLNSLVKGSKSEAYSVNRNPVSWIILTDKSSSMEEGGHLEQARQTIEQFMSIKPPSDSVSLLTFDTSTQLLVNYTTNQQSVNLVVEDIVSGTTTKLIPALQFSANHLQNAPYKKQHIIILTDGNVVDFSDNLPVKTSELFGTNVCITTISYGTFLLEDKTKKTIFEELSKQRCGQTIITQPTLTQLRELVELKLIEDNNVLLFDIDLEQTNSSTSLATEIYSAYINSEIFFENTSCSLQPQLTITPYVGMKELDTKTIPYSDDYSISISNPNITKIKFNAVLGDGSCQFVGERTIQLSSPEKEKDRTKIILAILLVTLITIFSFIVTLKIRLKRLSDKLKLQLKK